jgi:HAE1 family hydrophobic/amphiphilic exporter-1
MRIWLNPDRLVDYSLTVEDVIAALKTYNVEVSAGQLGGGPAVDGNALTFPLSFRISLRLLKSSAISPCVSIPTGPLSGLGMWPDGAWDRELRYQIFHKREAVGRSGCQAGAGANALDTADAVKAKLKEMSLISPRE